VVEILLQALLAVAFIAGGAGLVVWVGNRDQGVSWYPWPSATVAARMLALAASTAALALVVWVFLVTT
jgi:hypothetical protein